MDLNCSQDVRLDTREIFLSLRVARNVIDCLGRMCISLSLKVFRTDGEYLTEVM